MGRCLTVSHGCGGEAYFVEIAVCPASFGKSLSKSHGFFPPQRPLLCNHVVSFATILFCQSPDRSSTLKLNSKGPLAVNSYANHPPVLIHTSYIYQISSITTFICAARSRNETYAGGYIRSPPHLRPLTRYLPSCLV